MSMDLNVYLGIYFKCKQQPEIEKIEEFGCFNCNISYSRISNYCPKCGIKTTTFITTNITSKDFTNEIIDELEDEICAIELYNITDKYDIYIMNGDSAYSSYIEKESINNIKFNSEDIITKFKNQHKNIIDFFDKYYKKEYEIKLGLIVYYS